MKPVPALVTIGIPCFNSAKWIREAVESALAQTWPAREVIVVDDGSTDGSREILRSFGESDPASFARSMVERRKPGIWLWREARGEWLQFLGCR